MNSPQGKSPPSPISRLTQHPYRVFFPLAILVSILAVLMWPLFYWGVLGFYPLEAHAHLMIQGLLGGFAIGFMGTALPKMLGFSPLRFHQLGLLVIGYITFCSCHLLGYVRLGDGIFVATLGYFVVLMLIKVANRKTTPPAVMLLAGSGLVSGLLGALWLSLMSSDSGQLGQLAERLLYQAFLLFPLLGIGSFLFPLISNSKKVKPSYKGELAKRLWKFQAIENLTFAVFLLTTYWMEVYAPELPTTIIRAIFCSIYLLRECELHKKLPFNGIMDLSLRAGILCLVLGLLLRGVIETHTIALDHTLYIGGFGLIAIVVGSRVIFGHSGQEAKFSMWSKSFAVVAGLILLAMATRVSADFIPRLMISHHIYAAFCWIIAVVVWVITVFPYIIKYSERPRIRECGSKKTNLSLNPTSKPRDTSSFIKKRPQLFDEND